jgi:hypothetical protein
MAGICSLQNILTVRVEDSITIATPPAWILLNVVCKLRLQVIDKHRAARHGSYHRLLFEQRCQSAANISIQQDDTENETQSNMATTVVTPTRNPTSITNYKHFQGTILPS